MIVELPCFFHIQNGNFDKAGIDYDLSNCEVKNMLFVGNFSVSKYLEKATGANFSRINFNGNSAVCALTYDEVKELIQKQIS